MVLGATTMPIGLEPSPVDCRKNARTRIESRGISSSSLPWRSSRYTDIRPARRSKPFVRAAMVVAIAGAWPDAPALPVAGCVACVADCVVVADGRVAGAGVVLGAAGLHAATVSAAPTSVGMRRLPVCVRMHPNDQVRSMNPAITKCRSKANAWVTRFRRMTSKLTASINEKS